MNSDERLCPECAEVIKKAAKKCKHCHSIINSIDEGKINDTIDEVALPEMNESKTQYAGFWRRFSAISIEVFIGFVIVAIWILSNNLSDIYSNYLNLIQNRTFWAFSFLSGFLYNTILEYKYGGTLGKLFVGLRVVRTNQSEELSYVRCVGRYFAFFLSVITLFIGVLIQPFTKKRQSLHDLIVDTVVIDIKKRPSSHIWLINICYLVLSFANSSMVTNSFLNEKFYEQLNYQNIERVISISDDYSSNEKKLTKLNLEGDCTYSQSSEKSKTSKDGTATLVIKIFKEDSDTHAVIKLVADKKEHVVDSFGQQNFSVTANDLKVHVSGGGSWYRTDFNMDRMSGSYILTESERLDKSGYNWSTNKLYGVCMTTESGS